MTIRMQDEKDKARKILNNRRKQAANAQPNAANAISARLLASHFYKSWPNVSGLYVSGYIRIGSEIDVLPLLCALRARGAKLLMPAVIGTARPLEFREWNENTRMQTEAFGTKAPHPNSPAHTPNILCVPLLGFDDEAYRLGYGGGFYDRSLQTIQSTQKIISIGVAYEQQRLDKLPRDVYDIRLNAVITPDKITLGAPYR